MPKRSLLILHSFLLKEACGRLQKLLGVVFVREDIGWGYGAIKLYRALILEASSGPERYARKGLGLLYRWRESWNRWIQFSAFLQNSGDPSGE
jgi:hypothetical protein